ncbi:MAG TPA: MerR family transcriptional regulator [Nakamurella sp.]|jgi:DNA-binding transcriptional MerR regulator|nr:MerR family transcriptional regulator [Nakamurella sp.]
MQISELAGRAGTTPRALRFYEQAGLLVAGRDDRGYRHYDESDLAIVRQIRELAAVGFSLEETRPFVECLRAGNSCGDVCADSIEGYRAKLAELDSAIAELQSARSHIAAALRTVTEHTIPNRLRPADRA